MEAGERVVISTPDRRDFRGRLVEVRRREDGRSLAVVRLDTGWVTTYPLEMVHPDVDRSSIGE